MDKKIFLAFLAIFLIGIVVYFSIPFEIKFFSKESVGKVISGLPYYVDKSGWTLVQKGKTNDQLSLFFEQHQQDTFKHIIFGIDEQNDAIKVIQFSKEFNKNSRKIYLRMDSE